MRREIIEAAATLNIHISQIHEPELLNIRNEILFRYSDKKAFSGRFFWECFTSPSVSSEHPNGWRWIGEFIGSNPTIMYFQNPELRVGFRFNSGEDIVKVFDKVAGGLDDFCLTNSTFDYVLCYTHDGHLCAWGLAMPWLAKKIAESKNDETVSSHGSGALRQH